MAFIRFKSRDNHNHLGATVSYEQAREVEAVMKGVKIGSPKQQAYVQNVQRIYFGKQHEPEAQPSGAVWWTKE